MCLFFQVGIYAVYARRHHIICAIRVHTRCARDALEVLNMYVLEETKAFAQHA